MKVWKIRNTEGLFSTGSFRPRFTKEGKTWNRKMDVEAHIRQFHDPGAKCSDPDGPGWTNTDKTTYNNCHVVEFELVEDNAVPVSRALQAIRERDKDK